MAKKKIVSRTRDEVYHIWVQALRSGEYTQGIGCLRGEDTLSANDSKFNFCCLGVLCDLAVKDGGLGWDTSSFIRSAMGAPPDAICEFMGLENEIIDELIDMNDSGQFTFNEIADTIETVIMPALDVK